MTSTEIDLKRAWAIGFEFSNDEDGDDYDDIDSDVTVDFLRYTKGEGLTVLPFLAF